MSDALRPVAPLAPSYEGARSPPAPSYDGAKSPDEIELDIARTRSELGTTLKTLEQKLMPEQLMGQILGQISEKGVVMLKEAMDGDFTRIADRIRENPLPAALIGAGIGYLLLSGTSSNARGALGEGLQRGGDALRASAGRAAEIARAAAGRAAGDAAARHGSDLAYAREKLGEAAGYVGEQAGHLWQGATSRVGDMMPGGLSGRAKDYAQYAGDQANRLGERASAVIEAHPLVVGGLGLIAGILIGMALPARRGNGDWHPFGAGTDRMAAQMSRSSTVKTPGNQADPSVGGGTSETFGGGEAEGAGV